MLLHAALAVLVGGVAAPAPPPTNTPACMAAPAFAEPPEYYTFPLVSTRRVPGSGQASGTGQLTFATSPFGLSLAPDGSYRYNVAVAVDRLATPRSGTYVVWLTTPSLDRVELVGELDESRSIDAIVDFNKFLVVITLEDAFVSAATRWAGPIVLRGMSRSGMMHTMAGHGPFEQENCASFGY